MKEKPSHDILRQADSSHAPFSLFQLSLSQRLSFALIPIFMLLIALFFDRPAFDRPIVVLTEEHHDGHIH